MFVLLDHVLPGYGAAEFGDLLASDSFGVADRSFDDKWYGFISPAIRDRPFLLLASHRCLVVAGSLAGPQSLVGKETGSSVGVRQAVVLHHMQTWFK